MAIRRAPIEDTFKEQGIQADAVTRARTLASKKDIPLRQALLETDGVDDKAVARAYSRLSGLPVLDNVDVANIVPEHIRQLPHHISRENGILPLYVDDAGEMVVGMADLQALAVLDDLRILYGMPVRPVIVPSKLLRNCG